VPDNELQTDMALIIGTVPVTIIVDSPLLQNAVNSHAAVAVALRRIGQKPVKSLTGGRALQIRLGR
jgi:hypothetical protein